MDNKTSEAQIRASRKYIENNDRVNIIFPKGTKERITELGFNPTSFIRETILNELEKLERIRHS